MYLQLFLNRMSLNNRALLENTFRLLSRNLNINLKKYTSMDTTNSDEVPSFPFTKIKNTRIFHIEIKPKHRKIFKLSSD